MVKDETSSYSWYSKRLFVENKKQMDDMILGYIVPLLERIEEVTKDYRFHFFRYSDSSNFYLRLRVGGAEGVMRIVKKYETSYKLNFQIDFRKESYDWLGGEKEVYGSEDEVEKAMLIYEFVSRFSIKLMKNGVQPDNHIFKFNHLFLNALGRSVEEEYDDHKKCIIDRIIVLTGMRSGKLSEWIQINCRDEIDMAWECLGYLNLTLDRMVSRAQSLS